MDIKDMRRSLVICMAVILAMMPMTASGQEYLVNKVTEVAVLDEYDEVLCGIDKNLNNVTIAVKQTGRELTYSILDSNLKPTHSFVINNVREKIGDINSSLYFDLTDNNYYFEYNDHCSIVAIQGLLEDENKWSVIAVFDDYKTSLVSEDGEIYITKVSSYDPTISYTFTWVDGVWYLQKGQVYYTLRSENRPSAVNEIPTAEAMPVRGVYTLDGVKADKADKGMYIVDGKKVVR